MVGVEGTVDQLAVGGVPSTDIEIEPRASWSGVCPSIPPYSMYMGWL